MTRIAATGATPQQAAAIVAALDAVAAPGAAAADYGRHDRGPLLRHENARWDVLRAAYRARTRDAR